MKKPLLVTWQVVAEGRWAVPPTPDRTRRSALADAARAELAEALRTGDDRAAEESARVLLQTSATLPELYSDVVQPVLDEVGRGWAAGRTSISQEHTVTAAARTLVAGLRAARPRHPRRSGRIVLLPVRGEAHVLGLAMLEHALLEAGWRVVVLDAMPLGETVRYVRDAGDVALLGFTLHSAAAVPVLRQDLKRLRGELPALPVLVGGLAVRGEGVTAGQVGADAAAGSLAEAVERVGALTDPPTPRERVGLHAMAAGRSHSEAADQR